MDIAGIFYKVCVYAIPMVLAVTVHETAHGYVAKKNGDYTADNAGRLTLNPLAHIDPIGTVVLPLFLLVMGAPFLFGWAKPVPVNPYQFKDYRKGMRQVAAAGPLSNLLMMFIWAALYVGTFYLSQQNQGSNLISFINEMSMFGMVINTVLCVFNLVPIPPLDGSRIVNSYLSPEASSKYMKLEPYGFWIVLAALFLGLFQVMGPIVNWAIQAAITFFDKFFHLFM
ncbi:site-2 protease family protein [Neisseriaceae bacterium PsAf]|nr:site-2 protease family protein [Neisseriaceae bacterium PsAf]